MVLGTLVPGRGAWQRVHGKAVMPGSLRTRVADERDVHNGPDRHDKSQHDENHPTDDKPFRRCGDGRSRRLCCCVRTDLVTGCVGADVSTCLPQLAGPVASFQHRFVVNEQAGQIVDRVAHSDIRDELRVAGLALGLALDREPKSTRPTPQPCAGHIQPWVCVRRR